MEQIDAQVSDLRYLSQAPIALSGHDASASSGSAAAYGSHSHSGATPPTILSPGSASIGDNSAHPGASAQGSAAATPLGGTSTKRKELDDANATGKQTRSKRNRVSWSYLPIATCREWQPGWPLVLCHLANYVALVSQVVPMLGQVMLKLQTVYLHCLVGYHVRCLFGPRHWLTTLSNECKRRKIKCNGETPYVEPHAR